jgi:hypothetical protein
MFALPAVFAAVVVFTAAAIGFRRAPHVMSVVVVCGFAVQPTLVFFVSSDFGPAKDVIVLAGMLSLLMSAVFGLRAERRRYDAWLVGAIVVLLGMYLVNPAGGHSAQWSDGARLVIEAFGLFLVGYLGPEPERTWRWAVMALLGVALLNAGLGLAQQGIGVQRLVHEFGYQFGEQVRTTSGGRFRSFGTLEDPFNYAALLALALVCVALDVRHRRLAIGIAALLAVGIAVSFVRTEVVLLAVIAAIVLVRLRRVESAVALLLATGVAAIGLLTLLPLPSASPTSRASVLGTLNGRTTGWSELLSDAGDLVAGRGVGAVGSGLARSATAGVYQPGHFQAGRAPAAASTEELRSVDSSYLATLADVGCAGLALLLVILGRMLVLMRLARPGPSGAMWVSLGLWLVIALDATTRSSITAFPYGFIALYLLGLSLARREGELGRAAAPVAARERPAPPTSEVSGWRYIPLAAPPASASSLKAK